MRMKIPKTKLQIPIPEEALSDEAPVVAMKSSTPKPYPCSRDEPSPVRLSSGPKP